MLLPILIPACYSSSPSVPMMCSAYRLNKQGDSRQPCHTPFSILNPSVVPCRVLTVASWPTYRFLRRQVRWSGIPIFVKAFHSLLWSTQWKASSSEVDVFLEFSCFFCDPVDGGNLISGSSTFSKSSLYIWKFLVHILLKLSLKDFEHYFPSMWNEHSSNVSGLNTPTKRHRLAKWIKKQNPYRVL